MSFTMPHGIVVLLLIRVVKTVLYTCQDNFSNALLLQTKLCNVVIYLVAG